MLWYGRILIPPQDIKIDCCSVIRKNVRVLPLPVLSLSYGPIPVQGVEQNA
jgi:hypothetical protein